MERHEMRKDNKHHNRGQWRMKRRSFRQCVAATVAQQEAGAADLARVDGVQQVADALVRARSRRVCA